MQPNDIIEYLNKIVGLHPDITPAGLSRYTLTDQRDGVSLKVLDGISDFTNPVTAILTKARNDASTNFLTDFSAAFYEVYEPCVADFSGNIGKVESSLAVNDAREKAVVQIWSWGVDAVLSIRAVQMYAGVTADIEIGLYSENDITEPIATFTVDAVNGRWVRKELEEPILLNLSGLDMDTRESRPRYFLAWDIPAGSYPRTNKFACCGQDKGFQGFFEVNGYSADTLSEMQHPITAKSHGGVGMGISIEASAACTLGNLFTRLDYSLYSASGWQWVLAKTLQHGGVVNLTDAFIKSQNINQYTLLSRESIYGIRSHAEAEYRKGINWLVQYMPGEALSYFKCRNTVYRVGQILV